MRAGKRLFRNERSSRNMAGNNVKFSTQADNLEESEKPKGNPQARQEKMEN